MKHLYTKISFILYFIFSISYLHAQPNIDRKRDMIIVTGYESRNHNTYPFAGTTLTDFNHCPPTHTYKYTNIDFNCAVASICDTSGRLLFYTNGYTIEDSTYQTMMNGDSLSVANYRYPDGSYVFQGAMILPMGSTDKYVVFHDFAPYGFLKFPNSNIDRVYFPGAVISIVDMKLNNNKGAVILKNKVVAMDSCWAPFSEATRHANGRDWWVLRLSKNFNRYKRLLVTPYGIDSLPLINNLPYINDSIALYGAFESKYSLDGSKFAHRRGDRIWLYDFDRCNGILSNRRVIYRWGDNGYCGVVFSPNGRYLYATHRTTITQYDTEASNIQASGIVVGVYDSTTVNINGFDSNTMFFQGWNGPDGKIYVNGPGGNQIWHVIESPNERGTACNVQLHSIHLPTWYFGTTPNFPNFRLGALQGSPCDTLGIEAWAGDVCVSTTASPSPSRGGEHIRVFPNPTNDILNIEIPENIKGNLYLYNALGQIMKQVSISNFQTQLNTYDLSNGVYYISIYENNRLLGSRKFVVLHE